jgi:hypothetical protein
VEQLAKARERLLTVKIVESGRSYPLHSSPKVTLEPKTLEIDHVKTPPSFMKNADFLLFLLS